MGFLDQVKNMANLVTGKNTNLGSMFGEINHLFAQQGGLQGLVQKFQQNGLGEIIQSWISTGKNLPINGDQIQKVFGKDPLEKLAQMTGTNLEAMKSQLANHLPNLIDRLTPDGKIPSEGISLDKILSAGKNFFSKHT